MSDPWITKHAPKTVKDLILDPSEKARFIQMVETDSVKDMTLHGIQGIGKTTLANLIVSDLGDRCVSLFIPCGVKNGVDMVRGEIQDFADAYYPDKVKIVIMDEADSLSGSSDPNAEETNSAKKALRSVMLSKDTRFILTCNNLSLITPAIQSRCTPVKLNFGIKDIATRCVEILNLEKIKINSEVFKLFIETVIRPSFPDIRAIIHKLELWSLDGELKPFVNATTYREIDVVAQAIIEKLKTKTPLTEISKYYIAGEDQFNGAYDQLAGAMFKMLYDQPKIQLALSESIFRMGQVKDFEIQFYSALIQIEGMLQ